MEIRLQKGGGSQEKGGYFIIFNSVSFCKFLVAERRRDTAWKGARDRAKEVLFSLFCKCCCQTGQIDGDEELCFLNIHCISLQGWGVEETYVKYMLLLVFHHIWSWSYFMSNTGHLQMILWLVFHFWILYTYISVCSLFCLYINSVCCDTLMFQNLLHFVISS